MNIIELTAPSPMLGYTRHQGQLYKIISWKGDIATCRELTDEEVMEVYEFVQKFLNKEFPEGSTDEVASLGEEENG